MDLVRFLTSAVVACLAVTSAHAQAYPDATYDPAVPTLADVVGHDHGEAITTSADINVFLEALQSHAPDRMKIESYAESWQGRDLTYAMISSAANMARLDEIKANLAAIGNGETPSEATLENTPAVVWLSYGVHGNEVTPSDSAIFIAYHLLAAQDDELVDTILENTIVVIDANANPDGRERFLFHFTSALGMSPRTDRYAAEHDEPWPRGRFNHYVFDMNRDWFAITQPESQGRVVALQDWHPVVYVDSHEMGGDQTYYFPPAARPFNPNITETQKSRQFQLGRNMASWFDRFGAPYFTREIFDAFYPGYGDMWPTLNGAIAMTFEQGSPRGLVFGRRDGTLLTYNEGVRNNVLSSIATVETVARDKNSYLSDYAEFRRTAIDEGSSSDGRYFVFDLADSRYEAEALARRLALQGIDVQRTPAGSSHCRQAYPAGALIVDRAQPEGRLINTLLSPTTPLAPDYIAEQESRRERGLNHELYDVTAWSMPLMDGVTIQQCRRVDLSSATAVSAEDSIPAIAPGAGTFGQVIPWSDGGQAKLVVAALKAGLNGKTTDAPFTQNGRVFPAGSVVFPIADNDASLNAELIRLAQEIGAETVPMTSSWVDDGPNFGSASFAAMTMPKVAMAWDAPTSPTSAGNTRFVLEQELGIPVAPIRVSTMSRADLSNYDVLVLPDSFGLVSQLGSAKPLQDFVRGGGVLVAIGNSVGQLASEDVGLLSTQLELATTDGEGAKDEEGARVPGVNFDSQDEYEAHIENSASRPEDIPGVLVRAIADPNHWLASGYDEATALVSGRSIYRPLNASDGTNVFRFADADNLLKSGYLWEENRLQLAFKPFVMAEPQGDGLVIAFTQSPTTRGYLNGLNLLLANAVVIGPARVAQ
ncbi:MAG: M14 family zinc carboxypeptidase [Pseudomonadota bacterium]